MKVFVYGTLKRGHGNHHLLKGSRFIGIDFIYGTLINLGPFPAVIEGKRAVEGEIYEIDEATLHRLDLLEGHPNFYERKTTVTINAAERVSYYQFKHPPQTRVQVVLSGKWS